MLGTRGESVGVTLLVLFALLVSVSTFFIFVTNDFLIQATLANPYQLDDVYATADQATFTYRQLGERAFIRAYSEIYTEKEYVSSPRTMTSGYVNFNALDQEVEALFLANFEEALAEEIETYKAQIPTFRDFAYTVDSEEGAIVLSLLDEQYTRQFANRGMFVTFVPGEQQLRFSYRAMGLVSFAELDEARSRCSPLGDLEAKKSCYASLGLGVDVREEPVVGGDIIHIVFLNTETRFWTDRNIAPEGEPELFQLAPLQTSFIDYRYTPSV